MPDYDAGFKIVARVSGRQVSRLGGVEPQAWEPLGGDVQAAERLADRAFLARQGGERFVVYMEAYTRWSAAAPWSVLAKSGLLAERERLPVRSLVYVLLPRGYRAQGGTFRLALESGPAQQVWFNEICLWRQEPQPWWEEATGLMALYPLCRHGKLRCDALEYPAQVIRRAVRDVVVRADLLRALVIFGRLAYPDLPVPDLIGIANTNKIPPFPEFLAEGRVEGLRDALRETLGLRFGEEAAAEFEAALNAVTDPARLSELHRLAIRCRRITEFRRALSPRR